MELNTEINKVFGTEMAKLFASKISEEEMQETAKKVWDRLTSRDNPNGWGTRKNSDIESYIERVLLERPQDKIFAILREQENDEAFEKRARAMVEEAKKVADEAIIKSLASRMCEVTLNVWNNHDKFVSDVLNVLHVEKEKGRL